MNVAAGNVETALRFQNRVPREITVIFSCLRSGVSFVPPPFLGKETNSYVKSAQHYSGSFLRAEKRGSREIDPVINAPFPLKHASVEDRPLFDSSAFLFAGTIPKNCWKLLEQNVLFIFKKVSWREKYTWKN